MAELGWTDYALPSRGVLYGDKLPGGVVQLREMHAKQVALLQQQGGGIVGKLDAIVDTCCRVPPGLDKRDLLLTDRFAIMLALRTKSFGPVYEFRYRCRHCATWGNATVNIVEDLDEKAGGKDTVEPIEVPLDDANCIVTCRFLRGHDEAIIARNAKRMQLASNDDQDPSYLIRIAMQLVQKDGVDFASILEKQKFVDALTARDLYALEDAVTAAETGIDTRIYPDCRGCDAANEMRMPFTAEFFRPKRGS